MSISNALLYCVCAICLTGCWGSSVKPKVVSVCETLDNNDEWILPLLRAEKQFVTPVSTQLSLLEFPESGRGGKYVYARTGDWDEFRMRTERWDASPASLEDAITFAAWFSQQSRERNNLDGYAAGDHFLAIRLGHGAFHRMEKGSVPDLESRALSIDKRAKRWRLELKQCRHQWTSESWFETLKFW